jgi:hypothetical protein
MHDVAARRGRPALFELIDHRLDGQLADVLRELDTDDRSFEEITFRLRTEHSVLVSTATVRRWLRDIREIDAARAS